MRLISFLSCMSHTPIPICHVHGNLDEGSTFSSVIFNAGKVKIEMDDFSGYMYIYVCAKGFVKKNKMRTNGRKNTQC